MKNRTFKISAILIITILISGLLGGIVALGISQDNSITAPLGEKRVVVSEDSAITEAVKKTSDSVVSIVSGSSVNSMDPVEQGKVIGSGFFVSSNGLVVTNAHVVDNPSQTYVVVTQDKKMYKVEKINRDSGNDIALLKISGSNFKAVELGDSDSLQPGQRVIAIGTALGKLNNTVTTGVISAIGRGITASNSTGLQQETIDNVIQVDAALNPGNSGGPLIDLSGKVVGINFAITENAENIGFAIPSNVIKKVISGQI